VRVTLADKLLDEASFFIMDDTLAVRSSNYVVNAVWWAKVFKVIATIIVVARH